MNILIIEDEDLAAEQLAELVTHHDPTLQIVGTLDSVEDSVRWLSRHGVGDPAHPDLIFLDIQLSDGLSFSIFNQVDVVSPVIFTTAYDQYAIQAFTVNSLHYLLKPIAAEQIQGALQKWRARLAGPSVYPAALFQQLAQNLARFSSAYKSRFLVKYGGHFQFKRTDEIAYFFADGKIVYLVSYEGKRYLIDYTLEELESQLNPVYFFRVNRKLIIQLNTIKDIRPYLGGRLRLNLQPAPPDEVVVSRDRVADFKGWLEQ